MEKDDFQNVFIITNRKDLPARKDELTKEIYTPVTKVTGILNGVNRTIPIIDNTPVVIGGVGGYNPSLPVRLVNKRTRSYGVPLQYLGMTDEQIESANGKKVSLLVYPQTRNVQFIVHDNPAQVFAKDIKDDELRPYQLYNNRTFLDKDSVVKGTLSKVNSITSVELKNDKGEVTLVECEKDIYRRSKSTTRIKDMHRMVGQQVEITSTITGGMIMNMTKQQNIENTLNNNNEKKEELQNAYQNYQENQTGYFQNETDEKTAMIWFNEKENKMQACYGDLHENMPILTLNKTTQNNKDLYFSKHNNNIIMVLQNPKHPDKLQLVITGKDEDIKNAKMVDLKPSYSMMRNGEKDITLQKINRDLKMNLNFKNKEVSKSKNTGIEI